MVAGVAGGIARRFGLDHTLVRIAFALAAVGGGTGMVAYLVCWLLVPVEGQETSIAQLRRFKEDVREVEKGYECGIGLENWNDIKEGDVVEAYEIEEVAATLN